MIGPNQYAEDEARAASGGMGIGAHPRLWLPSRPPRRPETLPLDVIEAIRSRFSCRAFLPDPVPEATVRAILEAARLAPSGGNVQPWHVHVLTGAPLAALVDDVAAREHLIPRGEGAEYAVYPHPLGEPYQTRRHDCGAALYASLGIPREDRPARHRQFARNYRFFDAPVGLFVSVGREMGPPQWSDLGMFIQTLMLAARAHGLHTCAQEAWTAWHETLKRHLGLPDHRMVFCGLALGFADMEAPINGWRTERAEVGEFAEFRGFGG